LLLQELNKLSAKKNEIVRYQEYSDAEKYNDERTYLGLSISFNEEKEENKSRFKSYNDVDVTTHPLYDELLKKLETTGGVMLHAVTARQYSYTNGIVAEVVTTKNKRGQDQKIVVIKTMDNKLVKFILQTWQNNYHVFNKDIFKGDCVEILYEKQGAFYQLNTIKKRE
jgi:hypothetical protein